MDYFSSLLRQTGVTVETDREATDPFREEPAPGLHADDAIVPLEVEEQVLLEPSPAAYRDATQSNTKPLVPQDAVPAAAKPSSTRPQPGTDSGEQAPTGELATAAVSRPPRSKSDRAEAQQMTPEQLKSPPRIYEIRDAREEAPPPREPPAVEAFLSDLTFEPKTGIRDVGEVQAAPRSVIPAAKESGQRRPASPPASREGAIERERIVRTVIREVRQWVAAQPALSTEEERDRVAVEVAHQVEQALPAVLDRRQSTIASRRRQAAKTEQSDKADLATEHVHLSIGPINVTIARPDKEARRPQPLPRNEAGSSADRRSSRLSRRYILP